MSEPTWEDVDPEETAGEFIDTPGEDTEDPDNAA